MATAAEVKDYREDLLEAGVCVADFDARHYSLLKNLVKASDGNPASEVHGVNAEDLILCGVFQVKGGSAKTNHILVLPSDRSALEAVIDFLHFEAMRPGKPGLEKSPGMLLLLARKIEEQGVKSKILEKLEFKNGTTAIATEINGKERITKGNKARVIGPWAVHKSVDGKGYSVTHTTVGSAAIRYVPKKKIAEELAKRLAEKSYPWRLLRKRTDTHKSEWKASRDFAVSEIEKTWAWVNKDRAEKHDKAANPAGKQLLLF